MRTWSRRRSLILISAFIAVDLTSTSSAPVTISNSDEINAAPYTPPVHMAMATTNTSNLNVSIDSAGSQSHINMTGYFYLGGQDSLNISNLFMLTSLSSASFGYLTNVTLFNGQKTVQNVSLYSHGSNGTFYEDYNFTAPGSYHNNSLPVTLAPGGNSSFGLYIELGKSGYGGPYTWNLNFEINGYSQSTGTVHAVYTQYFVDIKVTTVEVA